MAFSAITGVPRESSGCKAPLVPIRTMVSERGFSRTSRVAKSTLANASSSVTTMSMLSGPIPWLRHIMGFPLYVPPMVWNSREDTSKSRVSKNEATISTRPGSPTRMMRSVSCSGSR